jgi:spermidine synthase
MQRLFKPLVWLAVPVAAFLTFLLQPIVGKILMPRYGGSASTWITVTIFFQAALLGGYALAFWLLRMNRPRALKILLVLAVAGPLLCRLPPPNLAGWPEWPAIFVGLTIALLPAILLTTSLGIVLQGWLRDRDGLVPYHLYGISNLGSLAALFAYPFAEPDIGLAAQIHGVHVLLWILGGVTLALVGLEWRRPQDSRSMAAEEPQPEHLSAGTILSWLLLAFTTCVLMLGSVRILSAEIGSNPFSWIIPLGLYLLSFTITFSGWWNVAATRFAVVALGFALFGYMHEKGLADSQLTFARGTWLAAVIATGSIVGHAIVYQLRPQRRFPFFYLVVACAGLLGGLFSSVGAPNLFSHNYEFAGAALVLLLLGGLHTLGQTQLSARLALAALLAVPTLWYGISQVWPVPGLEHFRNHYGRTILSRNSVSISSSSETTLHGSQLFDEKLRNTPTSYYTKGSGVGIVLTELQQKQSVLPRLQIGVIGLGTGTIAAYARPGDTVVFWEINPLAEKIARESFHFLDDCAGKVEVRLVDGRVGVRNAPEKYDVLVVDAFSGDSIPIHLVTREAIQEYQARLGDGILVVHISNRYADLFPVLSAHAMRTGWNAVQVDASPNALTQASELAAKTKYVLMFPRERSEEVDRWIAEAMKRSDYDYEVNYPSPQRLVDWTDDRHAILDVLRR